MQERWTSSLIIQRYSSDVISTNIPPYKKHLKFLNLSVIISANLFKIGSRRGSLVPVKRVDVVGGDVQFIAPLKLMQADNPAKNWEIYSNWADSVRSFPKVTKQKVRESQTSSLNFMLDLLYMHFSHLIKQYNLPPLFSLTLLPQLLFRQLRPLSELVKEVHCAGLKKLYLRRAIEQYLTESDPCHCRPCSNNGLVVMDGDTCKCICKPNTSGLACEQGTEAEGQPGGCCIFRFFTTVLQSVWYCMTVV